VPLWAFLIQETGVACWNVLVVVGGDVYTLVSKFRRENRMLMSRFQKDIGRTLVAKFGSRRRRVEAERGSLRVERR